MMTPIASTLESMTTIMTGQYPHTHGLQHMYPSKLLVSRALRSAPALPEILGRNGYKTIAMGDWCAGIFHVVPLGFQQVQASDHDDFKLYMAQAVYMAHFIVPLYFDNDFGYALFPRLQSFASYVTPNLVTERLVERLDAETQSDRPFFMTAFYSCTHIPYYCPPPYHLRYGNPGYNGRNKFKMDFNVDAFIRGTGIEEEFKRLPPHEVQQIRDLYDGCVNFFDDQVGRVLAHLEKTGLDRNTIVIISSDHGDDLFEPNTTFSHGLSFNGGDQTNHMPFLIHVPGSKFSPGKVDKLTRAVDIAPTLLDLLELSPEPRFEGTSLMPYCARHDADLSLPFFGETSYLFFKRTVPGEEPLSLAPLETATFIDPDFSFHFVLKSQFEQEVLRTKQRCLRTEKWKLVFTPGLHRDIWQLFYLPTDPHCEKPVQLQNPAVWRAMEEKLKLWVDAKQECRIRDIFPDGEPAVTLPES
jgi:Sulfatase